MNEQSSEQWTVAQLIAAIKSDDMQVRTDAWLRAGELGAEPLEGLAQVMAEGSLEVGRAAKRAMWQITRTVGAPGAGGRQPTCRQLCQLLAGDLPVAVRRELLWMISELGDAESVEPVAALLNDAELREDSRMVLERLPVEESLQALQAAFETAPQAFKPNLAQSLRKRGIVVAGYPCQKLVPTRPN